MNTKKIPVIFAINDFIVGGAQKLNADILNFLTDSRYELHLLTFFEFKDKNNFYELVNKHVIIHRLNFSGILDLRNWIKLILLLRSIRPIAVISNLFFSSCILRVLAPFFHYTISIVEHNTYINKKRSHIFLDKLLLSVTFAVVAVSDTVSAFLQNQINASPNKIRVIHNGVDLEKIVRKNRELSDLKKRDFGFFDEDKLIINVARLSPQKNHNQLIDFFSVFLTENPESRAKLIILGEGSLYSDLIAKVKTLNLTESVFILGNRDPFPYLSIGDMFVSTSIIEGLSIAYLEALACGLPILCTRTAGTDNLIVDGINGYFIDPVNQESFKQNAMRILSHGKDFYKKNALESVQKYSVVETCKAYSQLLNSMVSKEQHEI